MRPATRAAAAAALALLLLAMGVAGCGSTSHSSSKPPTAPGPVAKLKTCLTSLGYTINPETPQDVHTAPRRFEFVAVWNLLNPARISVALAISKSTGGAAQAETWTRAENKKLGKGVVAAPVVRFGTIDVLWTAKPRPVDVKDVYGCVRPAG